MLCNHCHRGRSLSETGSVFPRSGGINEFYQYMAFRRQVSPERIGFNLRLREIYASLKLVGRQLWDLR